MSEDTLREVLHALPAKAAEVRERLNLSHEETYAALVRLHDEGRAEVCPGPWRDGRARVWDRA